MLFKVVNEISILYQQVGLSLEFRSSGSSEVTEFGTVFRNRALIPNYFRTWVEGLNVHPLSVNYNKCSKKFTFYRNGEG